MQCNQAPIHQARKHIVTWIDTPDEVKEGYAIELKGRDGLWFVDSVYDITVEKGEINRSWKVGGL